MARIQPVKAGDVITEGLLNRIVDQFERFANLKTSSPYIRLWDGPHGKSIALALPQQTWARLSGSSSPYSFVEVRDGPGGTWVDMPNGDAGASNVYEANGKAGLSGKVVPITWTAAGDWRFQWVGVSSDFAWTFNVNGCLGTGLAGATIELRQGGVLIDSCVTADGTGGTTLGRCVLTVPAGSYDVTITGPSGAGFATSVSSLSIAAAKTTNTTLTANADSICWPCCNFPVPKVIHSSDSDGPITLTYDSAIGGLLAYESNTTFPVAETCSSGLGGVCQDCVSPSVARKRYSLQLLSGCTARLIVSTSAVCCDSANHWSTPESGFAASIFNGTIPVTSANCGPLNLVFNVPTTFSPCETGSLPTPGGGGIMAFTS